MLTGYERRLYERMAPVWSAGQRVMAPIAARQCLMALATLATGVVAGLAVERHSLLLEALGVAHLAVAAGLFGLLLGSVSAQLAENASGVPTLTVLWRTLWRAVMVFAANLYLGFELGGDGFSGKPWMQSGGRLVIAISLALAAAAMLNRYLWDRLTLTESAEGLPALRASHRKQK